MRMHSGGLYGNKETGQTAGNRLLLGSKSHPGRSTAILKDQESQSLLKRPFPRGRAADGTSPLYLSSGHPPMDLAT